MFMNYAQSVGRVLGKLLAMALVSALFAGRGVAQDLDPASWQSKLRFHAVSAYGPAALAGSAAYVGALQELDLPREWAQGGLGYSKRLGSLSRMPAFVTHRLRTGHSAAPDPRYYRLQRERILAQDQTCLPRHHFYTHRCGRRDGGHLALRKRLCGDVPVE